MLDLSEIKSLPVPDQITLVSSRIKENPNSFPSIGLDGPAGSGKTSVARELSKHLDREIFSNGLMYRSILWLLLRINKEEADQWIPDEEVEADEDKKKAAEVWRDSVITSMLENVSISTINSRVVITVGAAQFFPTHDELRAAEIAKRLPYTSDLPSAMKFVETQMRESLLEGQRLIIDGRDLFATLTKEKLRETASLFGMHVATMPEICLVYLYATQQALIERAVQKIAPEEISQETILDVAESVKHLLVRNKKEFTRNEGRVVYPEEAQGMNEYSAVIDTSDLSIQQVVLAAFLIGIGIPARIVLEHVQNSRP